LLREHYRCHPKIIEFCNKLFYDGELVPMTTDNGEEKVLKVIRTVPGNHARRCFNQREIDVILQEVMPQYSDSESIGIITPYNQQANRINEALYMDIASTVHKFQGRECDTIILSTVKNTPTDFSDNPNLLNVAISRAKKCLCIVTSGNEIPQNSNIAQLINYIHYNNFEVTESKLHSVFDLLYEQYTTARLEYEAKHSSVSSQLSENLIYNLMVNAIDKLHLHNIGVIPHYPLSLLIADWSLLNETETEFAKSPHSHVDFLVYNTLTKMPLFTVEVDGWRYHQANEVQLSRDALKDTILNKYGLTPHRISTTQTVNEDMMLALISDCCKTV
ncbi:MAG: AAA domain-containing protein, partial [Prevotella sp.]|nr:AAA domain-containing protein [Prevotella sp.]